MKDNQARRPLDPVVKNRLQRRHLRNRRDTLVIGILEATKIGDDERVSVIRAEANKVNAMLASNEKEYHELTAN